MLRLLALIALSLPAIAADGMAVIQTRCVRCHNSNNSNKPPGNLNLSTVELILKGGNQGPAMVLGNSEKSLIWLAVQPNINRVPKTGRMPPFYPISDAEIDTIKNWIDNLKP
jgi:mono/diheme cytochrome c family protein